MKKHRLSFSLSLTPMEMGLGWLYLAAEFLLIPPLIYTLGGFFGGFSDAAANFIYYFTNALCCGFIFRRLLRQSLHQAGNHPAHLLLCSMGAFLGYQIFFRILDWLLQSVMPGFSNVNDDAILTMIASAPVLMGIGTMILVPVAEECLFRGLLFIPMYRKNRVLGYLISALAFSAIHVVGYIGVYPPMLLLLCFLQYLPAGALLGWACAASGSLFAPILVHSAINALSFLTLR